MVDLFVARIIDLLTEEKVDLFVARIIDLLTDGMVDLFVFESTDRTVQYKLNAQSLRLFGLHSDVNDAHRASANRLQNKNKLYKVATPCMDDHHFKEEEMGSVGELSKVCSQIVQNCFYLARIGRPDLLWSVNELAYAITNWTRVCDKCSARLISYIYHTIEYRQHCCVGNTAQQCSQGLFQDSDFAGDFEDSK